MWMVGALRSQVDVPIWQIRATRVAACLLAGGPDVPAKADGPPPFGATKVENREALSPAPHSIPQRCCPCVNLP